ncbi:ABC transporter permease [Mycolicibacterium sp. P1-5]|uniref:ABC transporter permease n=1 Tax=Mycolicibacterium sp. P1-5 TaxID=2024617 RepID=UPI0011EBB45E|nr:ABC transporter permease [Mycolicibacterium sp. P1-5]KAA0110559.1 ABC transporter permease [Mycolicibacterium sp. P1-5]
MVSTDLLRRPAGNRRTRRSGRSVWAPVLGIAIVLAVWQVVYLSGWKPSFILPSPATVLSQLWSQAQHPVLWDAIGTTMSRALWGFGLALVIGTAVGVVVSRNRLLRAAFGPIITGLQTMPAIAWFPFAIIFFGITTWAILFVIVIGTAPAIATGVLAGSDHIPPLLLRSAKSMGLHGVTLYRHLILPASLPMFVAGLKQGWAFAWRSLMSGELVVIVTNSASIGVLLENAQNMTDMPSAIAIMIVILILGIVIDALFTALDKAIRRRWGLVDSAGS